MLKVGRMGLSRFWSGTLLGLSFPVLRTLHESNKEILFYFKRIGYLNNYCDYTKRGTKRM
jgi:hypothetical protein